MEDVLPGVYAVVKINGFSATTTGAGSPAILIQSTVLGGVSYERVAGGIPTPSPSYANALGIDFSASNFTSAHADFSVSFFDTATNLPVNVTQTFTVFDLDTAATGGLQETVGIGTGQLGSFTKGAQVTDNGLSGGFHLFSGPSSGAAFVDVDAQDAVKQPDLSVVFDVTNQSSIDFRWQLDRSSQGSNSRRFYLAGMNVVPEPSAGLLASLGISFGIILRRRRRPEAYRG